MSRKLGPDAFDFYAAMGLGRSLQGVAEHFEVSKRAVVKAASREGWSERLERIEAEARVRADKALGEGLEQIRLRHLQLLKAMGARVARALGEFPLSSGMEAIRAAEVVIRLERLIAGEPSERTELAVEQVTRQEIDRLLVRDPDPDPPSEDEDDASADPAEDAGEEY